MSAILANTITPVAFLGCWQLIFGNALIGLIEARVVRRFLGPGRRSPIWMMIGANYFSMLVGWFFLVALGEAFEPATLGEVPLLNLHRLIIAIIVLNLVFSVLLEWPFVHAALGAGVRARRSLAACITAQGVSYLLLLVPFWLASSVMDGISIVPVEEISRNRHATILFIGNDGSIHRVALDGSAPVKDRSLPPLEGTDPEAVLQAGLGEQGRPGLWLAQRDHRQLIDDSPDLMAQLSGYFEENAGFGRATYLYLRRQEDWAVVIGDPRYFGMDAWKRSPLGERLHVAVSTPFFTWPARCGSVLPNEQVIFELENHILLVDLPTRQAAIVAVGRGPVVLLPPSSNSTPATSPSIAPP